jgi:hypothetical protein
VDKRVAPSAMQTATIQLHTFPAKRAGIGGGGGWAGEVRQEAEHWLDPELFDRGSSLRGGCLGDITSIV